MQGTLDVLAVEPKVRSGLYQQVTTEEGRLGHVRPQEGAPSQERRHLARFFSTQTEVPIVEHGVPILPVEACRIKGLRGGLVVQGASMSRSSLDRLRQVRFCKVQECLAGVVQLGDAGGVLGG